MSRDSRVETGVTEVGPGLRPVEGIIAGYLAWTCVALSLFHREVPGWGSVVALNLGLILLLFGLPRLPVPRHPLLALLRRLIPLVFIPIFYAEVATLNDMFFPGRYFDSIVIGWERALFGGEILPLVLHQRWPWTWLSEYLHFAYFAYYFVIPTPFVVFALRKRWDDSEEYLSALMLIFVACQLCFTFFPVQGPFHEFVPPDPRTLGKVFPPLVHGIVHSGSSVGSAFPSSHCAVAAICWIVMLRKDRVGAWILAAIVPALTLGTIYGGFHYGVDALAGWALTLLLAPLAFRLHRRWERRRRESDARGGDPS